MNQDAVLQLLARERRAIQACIRARVADYHLAEDILQEVFVVALQRAEQFREGTHFRAWVREIALRTAWAHLRKAGRGPGALDPDTLEAVARVVEVPPEVWEAERAALQRCVAGLEAESRELLRLRYVEEAPLARIADRRRTTVDGIKGLLKRLRARLADCVAWRLKEAAP